MIVRSAYGDGESWTTLYRLTDPDGMAYAMGSISAVGCKVTDETVDGGTDLYDEAIIVGNVWFDTLQLDFGWSTDLQGYNFRHTIAHADLSPSPEGGHVYLARYNFATPHGPRIVKHYVSVWSALD